ncbi:hypothetical protein EDD85DRAFT_968621 [Armillaria nabsnona]|nr:hypothetical protein EDD85DRAFT_968621 [Armillaria nabsnona]
MIIVDVMHNLFLGLLKTHFRCILGFHIQRTAESKPDISINIVNDLENPKPTRSNDLKSVHEIISLLEKTPLKMLTDVATIENKLQSKYKPAKGLDCLDEDISRWHQEIDDRLEAKHMEVLQEKGCPSKLKQLKTSIPGSEGAYKSFSRHMLTLKIFAWVVCEKRASASAEPAFKVFDAGLAVTHQEMEHLWDDLQNTTKPSWLASIPLTVGGRNGDGKLKADQWCNLGLIYMPLMLIQMCTVIVATSYEASVANAEAYLHHMKAYRALLQDMFPEYKCLPNHHMAMHISEYLLMFRPVQNWWTFPFERAIGTLERISTNYKAGEYEEMIACSFHRMNNLRQLQNKGVLPKILDRCKNIFEKLMLSKGQDPASAGATGINIPGQSNSSKILSCRLVEPPNHIADAFEKNRCYNFQALSKCIRKLSYVSLNGAIYSVASRHHGNSQVMVQNRPFCIKYMMQDPNSGKPSQVLVVAQRFRATLMQDNAFEHFPELGAQVWHRLEQYSIFNAQMIETHFVSRDTNLGGKSMCIVLSIKRALLLDPMDQPEEDIEMHLVDEMTDI